MKKLLFLASLLLVAHSYAQNTAERFLDTNLFSGTSIVARMSYDNITMSDYAVSYTSNPNDRGFLYSNQYLNGRYFSISGSNIHINDLCILDDIVYFCGYSTLGDAVVGKFKVSEFQQSAFTLQYYIVSFNNYTPVSSFTKIKAYYDDNIQMVVLALVAKNQDIQNPSNNNSYLCYLKDEGTSFSGNCFYLDPPKSYHNIEDVVITKNYIVAVGGNHIEESQGYLYRFKKSDIIPNPTDCDGYIITDPDEHTFTSIAAMEWLKDDEVAFACLRNYWGNNNSDMRVYTLDASAMQFLNTQDVPLVGKCSPQELLFMPCDGSLLMLIYDGYYNNINTPASLVYYIKPYSSAYNADFIYETHGAIRSIDRFNDNTRFLMGGNDASAHIKYWMRNKLSGFSSHCIEYDRIHVKKANKPNLLYFTPNNDGTHDNLQSIHVSPNNAALYPGCTE